MINNFSIKIHPLFLLLGVLAVAFGFGEAFISCLLATIFHEYAHFFVAKKLGMEIKSASLTPFGGMVEIPLAKYPYQACVAVICAGGLLNLSLAILLCALWWFCPETYGLTHAFARANITIALVNFLPCFPLDGGRGCYIWCKEVLKMKNAERILSSFGIVLGCVFILLFFLKNQNITLVTLGVFMILGSEKTLREMSQQSALSKWDSEKIGSKNGEILQENVFVASGETELYKVFFHFKRSGENVLKIRLSKGEVTISQRNLYKKILDSSKNITGSTKLCELFGDI